MLLQLKAQPQAETRSGVDRVRWGGGVQIEGVAMADSILVSILSGGLAGAAMVAAADLHSKIEEVPRLVRALQRVTDPPSHAVDSIDQADYYRARERSERVAAETLDRALSAIINSARRLGPKYVEAVAQVREAARLAASAENSSEQQSRNHALEQRCEQACTVGFK